MKVSKKHVTVKSNLQDSVDMEVEVSRSDSKPKDASPEDISVAQVNKTGLDKSKDLILSAIDCLSEYVITCTEMDDATRTKLKDSIANLSVVMLDLS